MLAKLLNSLDGELSNYVSTRKDFHISLLSSYTGISLFFAYLFLSTHKKKHLNKCLEILSNCIDYLNEYKVDSTLANGFTGLAWTIQHLRRLNLIDSDSLESISSLESFIAQSIDLDIQTRNYDLFYGAIGKGLYFIECPKSEHSIACLKEIILGIEYLSIKDTNGLTWQCHKRELNNTVAQYSELGLAHGVSSIVAFLSRTRRLNILPEKTLFLLTEALNWLLKTKKNNDRYLYPITIPNDGRRDWLAWCTGDLGIGIAIYHAGVTLNNQNLILEAIKIFENACTIDFEESGIHMDEVNNFHDAGLCHGCLGLAYAFDKFYGATQDIRFKKRSEYWISCSINLWLKHPNEFNSVMRFNGNKEGEKWVKDFGVLEGLAGIGLMLISFKYRNKSDWDRLFLLDVL